MSEAGRPGHKNDRNLKLFNLIGYIKLMQVKLILIENYRYKPESFSFVLSA